jgi:acetate kinase
MGDLVLVINAGSSSLKFSLFETDAAGEPAELAGGQIEGIGLEPRFKAASAAGEVLVDQSYEAGGGHRAATQRLINWLGDHLDGRDVAVVGHRVVHGGTRYARPVRIDGEVMEHLEALVPLAPLHQPHNLKAIEAVAVAHAGVPQVACFDTAFHQGQPFEADAYALPKSYYEEGLRRYGFHGLSYEFIARELERLNPELAGGRVVVAHLGNGASCCALQGGRSVDSTMGFTALDGLPMGTRCGQIDPGVLLYLMDEKGFSTTELSDLLYKESGLKGLSGVSSDMRELEASDSADAARAIRYFVYRIRREVAGLAAALEGLDGLVFTAGIGERGRQVRAAVGAGLGWLGVELDESANAADAAVISTAASAVEVRVIPTDEEKMIARHALGVIGAT